MKTTQPFAFLSHCLVDAEASLSNMNRGKKQQLATRMKHLFLFDSTWLPCNCINCCVMEFCWFFPQTKTHTACSFSGNCWPKWKTNSITSFLHSSPQPQWLNLWIFVTKKQQLGKTTSFVHLSWNKKSMTPENINKSNQKLIHFGGFDVNSDNFHLFISAKALNEWPPHVCFQLIVTSQAPEWPYLSTSVHNGAILEIPGVFRGFLAMKLQWF